MSPTIPKNTCTNRGFWDKDSRKHWRNLSPHQDNRTGRIYFGYYFGTLEPIEGSQLPGEDLDSILWLSSALSTVAAPFLHLQPHDRHLFRAQLTHSLQEPRWAKRLCPPNIENLCSDCCFWSRKHKEKRSHCCWTSPSLFKLLLLWLERLQSNLKGLFLFFLFRFSLFPLLGARY